MKCEEGDCDGEEEETKEDVHREERDWRDWFQLDLSEVSSGDVDPTTLWVSTNALNEGKDAWDKSREALTNEEGRQVDPLETSHEGKVEDSTGSINHRQAKGQAYNPLNHNKLGIIWISKV